MTFVPCVKTHTHEKLKFLPRDQHDHLLRIFRDSERKQRKSWPECDKGATKKNHKSHVGLFERNRISVSSRNLKNNSLTRDITLSFPPYWYFRQAMTSSLNQSLLLRISPELTYSSIFLRMKCSENESKQRDHRNVNTIWGKIPGTKICGLCTETVSLHYLKPGWKWRLKGMSIVKIVLSFIATRQMAVEWFCASLDVAHSSTVVSWKTTRMCVKSVGFRV